MTEPESLFIVESDCRKIIEKEEMFLRTLLKMLVYMKHIATCTKVCWDFLAPMSGVKKLAYIPILVFTLLALSASNMEAQPCVPDCDIQCEDQINVSLDQSCEAVITPAMGVINLDPACNAVYDIVVFDDNGVEIPNDLVDLSHRNKTLTFYVTTPACSNSCSGEILVEYKLRPRIICPPDLTLSCGALNILGVPPAVGACAGFEVFLFSETREPLLCDSMYTNIVTRTYKAVDDFGNEDVCSHQIMLKRLQLNDIIFPDQRTVAAGDPLRCSDDLYEYDENGFPLPWPSDPNTGSGSGVPILCDPYTGSGAGMGPFTGSGTGITVICPLTGSGNGIPLIPGPFTGVDTNIPTQVGCSAVVLYTDLELPQIGCVRKIMRTWEVREWWCNGESTRGGIQMIEIIDDEAPVFSCPPDFTVTTNDDCAASVEMPPVFPIDECDNGFNVKIDYPLGLLMENGGPVQLQVGPNIVEYIVNDDCYNISSCTVNVTVRDMTEPVTICDQDVDVNIGFGGMNLVYKETFDEGSWDECGLDRIEIRRMDSLCVAADTLWGDSVYFCCSDVERTDLMVALRAVDLGGNTNQCMIRVHVHDKIPPSMTCPPDMTLDCRDGYDLQNLGVSFGNPVVNDNCAETQIVEETASDDVNQCGIGEITREFVLRDPAGNIYQSCIQHISIGNETPFVEANILWPLDYQVIGGCDLDDLRPESLPDNYNFPVYTAGDDECSLLGYDYKDEVFEFAPGGIECVRIERTWTVINWCSQINGIFERWTIPQPQIIELINNEAPVMDAGGDLVFESGNINCESGDIMIERSATDDCENPLIWSYIVRDSDNNIVAVGDTNVIEGVYLVGNYTIEWSVHDGCGNADFDTQNFEVINTKTPSPVCLNGLTAYVEPADTDNDNIDDNEIIALNASFFDGGSYHTCNNPITISLSADTTIKTLIFDCDDLGLNPIELWVTDRITGAQDFCAVMVDIQDINAVNICPENSNRVNVAGEVYTEKFEEVEGVMVQLGAQDIEDMTGNDGLYAFNNMPLGGSYNIEPFKNSDPLNGISTLDLIMIQRHVLGIERLDSPYKLIAADVNHNDEVSTIDMIELRKLILGVYDEFPQNTSWRFVDATHVFVDEQNPWMVSIPESYYINQLSSDMDIDFIGVKTGDVNGSVIAHSDFTNDEIIDSRNIGQPLVFNIASEIIPGGETAIIPVTSKNYSNISGWQGTVEFDADKIEILDIRPGALEIDVDENFNLLNKEEGWITASYHDKEAEIITEDEVLFELVVQTTSSMNTANMLRFTSSVIPLESYEGTNNIKGLHLENIGPDNVQIISVRPNPWIESTEIEFKTSNTEIVEWQFYDVNGRLIYSDRMKSITGLQTYKVERENLNTSGIVYVRLITSEVSIDYKMVLLD